MSKRISFVIPTLNEERAIGPTLETIPLKRLESDGFEVEVLVVDGESTDDTVKIAEAWGARVVVEERPGYGRAYKTGFDEADGDVIVTGDADATYPFDVTPELLGYLEASTDFVTTNRFAQMEPDAMSPKHQFGNWVLSTGCKVLFGTGFADSQSGMWVFKREVLEKLSLTSDGMAFSEEIKLEAFRHPDVNAIEVGIPFRERIGEIKLEAWQDGFRNFAFLFQKRLGVHRD